MCEKLHPFSHVSVGTFEHTYLFRNLKGSVKLALVSV